MGRILAMQRTVNTMTDTELFGNSEQLDDTISRQAALGALGERPVVWSDNDDYTLGARNQYDMDRLALETVPSAQQWIPTSERLPDKSGLYLVTEKTAYGVNLCSRYWNLRQDRSFWSGWGGDKVLAWRPLPEPWKGERDG